MSVEVAFGVMTAFAVLMCAFAGWFGYQYGTVNEVLRRCEETNRRLATKEMYSSLDSAVRSGRNL